MKKTITAKPLRFILTVLAFVIYPLGLYKVWKKDFRPLWIRWTYTILGLPLSLLILAFAAITIFATFLPELDRSIGVRSDRSIRNSMDRYSVTFLKTSRETNGAYEEVKVDLDPGGGNEWHYHTAFVEKFHVIEGNLTVGMEGKPVTVTTGNDTIAQKGLMHKFYNTSSRGYLEN